MHVYTRNKAALHQSVMQTGERKSVWELVQLIRKAASQSRPRMLPDLCAARQWEIDRGTEMELKRVFLINGTFSAAVYDCNAGLDSNFVQEL